MKQHETKRSSFSGKIGFVLSAAGASVGLGNIWRFPYLAAKYGGGIFLVIYIILALTFGYTMIIAETSLGRMTRKSPVGAYASFGKSKWILGRRLDQCGHSHPHSALLFCNRWMGHKISCQYTPQERRRTLQQMDIFLSLFLTAFQRRFTLWYLR